MHAFRQLLLPCCSGIANRRFVRNAWRPWARLTCLVPVQNATAPSPRAAGEIEGCTAWWRVQDYNSCKNPLALFGFQLATFYAMNPSIGPQCTGMAIGTYYCVSTSPDGYPPVEDDPSESIPVTTKPTTSTGASEALTPSPIQVSQYSCDPGTS